MRIFFNNCRARNHAALFPAGAVYDLYLTGRQANMATDLKSGDECVVATPVVGGDIDFSWFSFTHERVMDMPDKPGTKVRVLFGKLIRSECFPKAEATESELYSVLFNVNGHFKRSSVIQPKGSRRSRTVAGCD
jgi:hypothetical protein